MTRKYWLSLELRKKRDIRNIFIWKGLSWANKKSNNFPFLFGSFSAKEKKSQRNKKAGLWFGPVTDCPWNRKNHGTMRGKKWKNHCGRFHGLLAVETKTLFESKLCFCGQNNSNHLQIKLFIEHEVVLFGTRTDTGGQPTFFQREARVKVESKETR